MAWYWWVALGPVIWVAVAAGLIVLFCMLVATARFISPKPQPAPAPVELLAAVPDRFTVTGGDCYWYVIDSDTGEPFDGFTYDTHLEAAAHARSLNIGWRFPNA